MKTLWAVFFLFISLQAAEYIKTDKSVVVDTKENLEWQDNKEATEDIWKMANSYCKQLKLNGREWRLPTKKELVSLGKSENLKSKFKFLEEGVYWSSDIDQDEDLNAITVYSSNGFSSSNDKCDKNFIICVHSLKD